MPVALVPRNLRSWCLPFPRLNHLAFYLAVLLQIMVLVWWFQGGPREILQVLRGSRGSRRLVRFSRVVGILVGLGGPRGPRGSGISGSPRSPRRPGSFRGPRGPRVPELCPTFLPYFWQRCFPVKFAKFLRTHFLYNTSERLLLTPSKPLQLLLLNFLAKFLTEMKYLMNT